MSQTIALIRYKVLKQLTEPIDSLNFYEKNVKNKLSFISLFIYLPPPLIQFAYLLLRKWWLLHMSRFLLHSTDSEAAGSNNTSRLTGAQQETTENKKPTDKQNYNMVLFTWVGARKRQSNAKMLNCHGECGINTIVSMVAGWQHLSAPPALLHSLSLVFFSSIIGQINCKYIQTIITIRSYKYVKSILLFVLHLSHWILSLWSDFLAIELHFMSHSAKQTQKSLNLSFI